MDLFAGLDISLNGTSICVIDAEGKIRHETKVLSEPEAIRSAFEGYADRLRRIGIEASSLGIWPHRELAAAGLPAIVVEARTCARHGPPCATRPTETTRAASRR